MLRLGILAAGVLAVAWLPGCGDEPTRASHADVHADLRVPGVCAVSTIDVDAARVPRPLEGVYFGQEVWLSYQSKEHEGLGYRFPRTRDEALHRIRQLCAQAHAGADVGALAREWSNAPGARAYGLCAVPLPAARNDPDARDVALFQARVGELTPLLEWHGGFWFARRIEDGKGRALGAELEQAARVRARARVIHIHHAGAWPRRYEFDRHPQEKAIATARWIIQEVRKGADFAGLAEKWSNDESRRQGGLLRSKHPVTGEPTEWLRWGDRNFPQPILDVILELGTPGEVWPEPVVSGWGVDVVFVVERRSD
ncbi:MAG: peptidylprolyl isomerase [Planctomycetota bacterium]|nr:peptidylprolyl isomerase [Planctomycetota bacterium]